MRGIKISYLAFFLALLAAFHAMHLRGFISFGWINVVLLLAIPIVYACPKSAVYLFLALPILIYPVFIIVHKIDPLNSAIPILTFYFYICGIIYYRKTIESAMVEWDARLSKERGERDGLVSELERLVSLENDIRDKELKMVSLYEITRRMSGSLRFEDIFNILGSFMKENLRFRKCEFAVLSRDGGDIRVARPYSVWMDRRPGDYDYKVDFSRLAEILAKDHRTADITRQNQKRIFGELGIEDDEVSKFTAVPLFSEKRISAILTVDNLSDQDYEKFMILAAQFAFEIKKVLLYETVEALAITDSLTGLFVRRYFLERSKEELYRSQRHKFSFAFLMMDIDDFKRCNDTYGHLVGDVVLKDVGRIIKESTREIDLVARYGGEEFSILLPETTQSGARLVAERIRSRIADNIFKAYDERLRITVSTGLAIYPEDSSDLKGVIENADAALYAAKKSGKNIVCEYRK